MLIKLKIFTLLLFIAFSFFSCNNNNSYKVGLLMDDVIQERWNKDRDFIIKQTKKSGGELLYTAARGDEELQFQQAEDLISKGVDALIVIAVDSEKAADIVNLAHKNGIKVIAYDRLIMNCDLDYYISFDNVKVGILQAQELIKQTKGNYALLNGPQKDNNSFLLKIGQMSVLQKYLENDALEVIKNKHISEYSKKEGYKETLKLLEDSTKTPDAIICGNDAIAAGAINAISDEIGDTFDIKIAGQDAEIANVQYIIDGKQAMTVYKPVNIAASKTAKIAQKIIQRKKIEMEGQTTMNNGYKMVPTLLIPPISITEDNIEQTLIKDGYINKELLEF